MLICRRDGRAWSGLLAQLLAAMEAGGIETAHLSAPNKEVAAATLYTRGCDPTHSRLQPYALEAATLRTRGCYPIYHQVTATSGAVQSYRGIIKLPGYPLQRRLDLKVHPPVPLAHPWAWK